MANNPIHTIFSRMSPTVREESSQLAGQQMITFILYSSTLVIGLAVNLTGLSGPQGRLPLVLNCIFLGMSLSLVLAYRLGGISMRHTFGVMTVVAQLFTCNEMVICAMLQSEYNVMLIVGNMVLLVANVMFSLIGHSGRFHIYSVA